MTRPINEPNTPNRVRGNQWGVNQLQRRPSNGGAGAWHYVGGAGEPAFVNSWVNTGGGLVPMRFRTNGSDIDLEGVIEGGAGGTVIFTLPTGFTPDYSIQLVVGGGAIGGAANIQIDPDGTVTWIS